MKVEEFVFRPNGPVLCEPGATPQGGRHEGIIEPQRGDANFEDQVRAAPLGLSDHPLTRFLGRCPRLT